MKLRNDLERTIYAAAYVALYREIHAKSPSLSMIDVAREAVSGAEMITIAHRDGSRG